MICLDGEYSITTFVTILFKNEGMNGKWYVSLNTTFLLVIIGVFSFPLLNSFNLYLYLPLIVLIQYILQLGIIFITSSIDVYIRDAEYIINFIVQMVFYATPVLYSIDMFPEKFRWILRLNPLATIIESYRNIFYYKTNPDFKMLGITFIVSFIILIVGYAIFEKLKKGFAEEL